MTLSLLRLKVDIAALARWAGERAWGERPGPPGRRPAHYDEGLALHHLLAGTFGPGALRPFRLLVPPGGRRGNLYAYATAPLDQLRATAAAALLPEWSEALDLGSLAAKAMPDAWRAGQRLGFDLRLRPVVRLKAGVVDERGRPLAAGSEVDAFRAEGLRRHPADPAGLAGDGVGREAVYRTWLAARLGAAARIEDARLVRFQRVRAARGRVAVEGPDAVIQGTLAVADPDAFAKALAAGVGRHRAYGYGMLLLRPPGRPAPAS